MPTSFLRSRPVSTRPVSRPRRALQLLIALALLPATTLGPNALQAQDLGEPIRIFDLSLARWAALLPG
ncbi:hypothetical protein [Kineosporia babensis]|uniref:Uncharacterized protein n=1 Tax=Kineosporia babensis TaxID=499548 RepID=A0A9X1NFQ2_9ACTN|nr:hypothetical protein [Kineosporia babensis]MCD5314152.1 hypothetical protein [Kineosporia babensis]